MINTYPYMSNFIVGLNCIYFCREKSDPEKNGIKRRSNCGLTGYLSYSINYIILKNIFYNKLCLKVCVNLLSPFELHTQ